MDHTANPNKLQWESPSHPYRERTPYEWREIIIRVGFVILLAVFFKQFLFAATIVAILFVVYLFSTIVPGVVTHKMDSNGITTQGITYVWEDLSYCYFTSLYGHRILVVMSVGPHIAKLMLPLGEMDVDEVHDFIEDYLPVRHTPAQSAVEKITAFIAHLFALD